MMKQHIDIPNRQFDDAVTDAFRDAPACGAFGTIDDLSRRRAVNHIVQKAASAARNVSEVHPRWTHRRVRAAGAIAAVLVLGIALTWYLVLFGSASPAALSAASYFGEVQTVHGAVFIDDDSAYRHAPLPVEKPMRTAEGTALLRMPTGIDWWMASHAAGKINRLEFNQLHVSVSSGENWFRVDPERQGPAFSVLTPMGRIHVTGTIFVVRVTADDVVVTLLKGKVLVQDAQQTPHEVQTGYSIHLQNGQTVPVSENEQAQLRQQLATLHWEESTATPTLTAASSTVDNSATGDTSVAVSASVQPATTDKPADIKQLHMSIQNARKAGDWKKVAGLYKRLIRTSPAGDAAIVSRVSLGDVYLSRLHRYGDALSQYDYYIQSRHPTLLPEATYGKCLALKAMKQSAREQQCLEQFVRRFPGVLQVESARSRLSVLQAKPTLSPDTINE
ncbi:MAG: FecR domain-containing protein [Deltaproteobacteria bacterium]|nr:FecR domain-containing protein [Deltaproteobacteria bacterium]MBN2671225.1 FecR domain-containing protein [Deltaproteobacteria bacterium]